MGGLSSSSQPALILPPADPPRACRASFSRRPAAALASRPALSYNDGRAGAAREPKRRCVLLWKRILAHKQQRRRRRHRQQSRRPACFVPAGSSSANCVCRLVVAHTFGRAGPIQLGSGAAPAEQSWQRCSRGTKRRVSLFQLAALQAKHRRRSLAQASQVCAHFRLGAHLALPAANADAVSSSWQRRRRRRCWCHCGCDDDEKKTLPLPAPPVVCICAPHCALFCGV